MHADPRVFWIAAAVLAVSAVGLALFGSERRRYGGWWWWLSALGVLALGLGLAAWSPGSQPVAICADALLLQGPVLCLIGVRRFHARLVLPASGAIDAAVALAATALSVIGSVASADGGTAALAPAAASLVVHLYAASLMLCGPADEDGQAMRRLGAALAVGALAPVLWALPTALMLPTLDERGMAALLVGVMMAFMFVTLVCDRTERQLRESRRRLRLLANIDTLTHVPNRRHFHELALRMLRADPPGSAALVLFDVDHFKQVNDEMGHAAGDRALRLVARSVQDVLRTDDVPGRYGGDEFVLLLRHASTAEAMGVADRIVTRVQTKAYEAGLPRLSLSFGIVHLRHAESLDDALHRADLALYEAKRQGRSRAVAANAGHLGHPVFTDSQRLGLRAA